MKKIILLLIIGFAFASNNYVNAMEQDKNIINFGDTSYLSSLPKNILADVISRLLISQDSLEDLVKIKSNIDSGLDKLNPNFRKEMDSIIFNSEENIMDHIFRDLSKNSEKSRIYIFRILKMNPKFKLFLEKQKNVINDLLKKCLIEEYIEDINLIINSDVNVGADVNDHIERWTQAILMRATNEVNIDQVKSLIDLGVSANTSDRDGITILMEAVDSGDINIVKLILDSGADVNACDHDGKTALMTAADCFFINMDIVRLLLDSGANINAKDNNGNSVISLAQYKDFVIPRGEIVRLLKPDYIPCPIL